MTRCSRDAISLKSSVYNQTGQSYTNQVSLHRRMCMHFRRVIQAKCVVDARNPRFTRVLQKRAGGSCAARLRFSEDCCCQCPSEDTIDRLAYDTHHHPSEVIRAVRRSKSTSKERGGSECERCCQQVCPCGSAKLGFDCCGGAGVKGRSSRPRSRLDRSCTEYSPQQCFRYRKSNSCTRNGDAVGRSPSLQRCPGPLRRSSSFEDAADTFRDLAERKSDEVRYAKFIYDLTQEIVRKGLYTDRELNEVFQKHLDNNSQSLNKRKMLYEIYQLKISLGMSDDTEDEEEDELEADLVYAERFSKLRVPKPPTPPKVLNENKVIERLETYGGQQQHRNETSGSGASSPAGCTRNVVLVDPNPELLVTETDVLTTLADECVDPEQIQRIYQNLCRRSKDAATLSKPMHVGADGTSSPSLKRADRFSSASSLDKAYMKERLRGILRKESTDFAMKSLSPELIRRQYAYLSFQQREALEKCEKWRLGLCDCDGQPCKKHVQVLEKDKKSSAPKVASDEVKDNKPQKRDVGVVLNKDQKLERNRNLKSAAAVPAPKTTRPSTASSRSGSSIMTSRRGARRSSVEPPKRVVRGSVESVKKGMRTSIESLQKEVREPEIKEVSSREPSPDRSGAVLKIVMEEKPPLQREEPEEEVKIKSVSLQNSTPSSDDPDEIEEEIETKAESLKNPAPASDDHEDIDEEIETEAEEAPASRPGTPDGDSSTETEKSDDDNEKDLPTVKEESETRGDDDDSSDTVNYSKNAYSDSSSTTTSSNSSAEEDEEERTSVKTPESTSSPRPAANKSEEVSNRRYSTVTELYARVANAQQQQQQQQLQEQHQIWQVSRGSSDSVSSGSEVPGYARSEDASRRRRPTRRRTSSGASGLKVVDSWNKSLSEITSGFYRKSESRHCESKCRAGSLTGSCAENCRFAKTNCRNLSNPTHCLLTVGENSESSASTDSS